MTEQENTTTVTETKDSIRTETIDILPRRTTGDVTNNESNIVVVPTNASSSSCTDSNKDKDSSPLRDKHLHKSPSPATSGKQILPILSRADTGSNSSSVAAPAVQNSNTQGSSVTVTSRRYNNIEDIITPTHTGMETPIQNKNITGNTDLQVKPKRNSLRRANIPPPLGLQPSNNNANEPNNSTSSSTSSSSSAASTHFNGNENTSNTGNTVTVHDSNKLNIPLKGRNASNTLRNGSPSHGRVTKPRVRYLGKMSRYATEHSANNNNNTAQQGPCRRPSTQLHAQAQFNAMLLYNQQQQQQQQQQYINTMMMMGMYPYMYNENMPMQMPMQMPVQMPMQMGVPPQSQPQPQIDMPMNLQPKSALLPNFPPQTYPYFRNQSTIDSSSSSLLNRSGYQGIDSTLHNHQAQAQAQAQAHVQHTHVSDQRQQVRNVSPHKRLDDGLGLENEENNDEEEEEEENDDDENADLAIESDALPTPIFTRRPTTPDMMQGEIRIMQNKFSFEFPVTNSQVDRKMFLSICNKIWTESRELDKDV